jgi:endogenous inhibitor of DNA gyrase (YacG/DUF329 family)
VSIKQWVETKPGTVFCSTRCAFPDPSVDWAKGEPGETIADLRDQLKRAFEIRDIYEANSKSWQDRVNKLEESLRIGNSYRRTDYKDLKEKIASLESDLVLKDGELNGKDMQIQSLKEEVRDTKRLQERLDEVVVYREKAERTVDEQKTLLQQFRSHFQALLTCLAPFRETIAPNIPDPDRMMWAKPEGYRNWSNLHKVWEKVEILLGYKADNRPNVTMTITKVCSNPCGASRWFPELGVWKTKLIQGVVYLDNGDHCPKCGKELK